MGKNYLKAVIACLLWSTAFAGVKIGLTYAPPFFFAGIRFMLAGLLVFVISGGRRDIAGFIKNRWRLILVVGLLQTGIMYGLYFHGVKRLPAGIAAIIVGAGPLIAAVTAHYTIADDKLTLRKIVSLLIALSGVILISAGRNSMEDSGIQIIGILLLLLSSLANAFSQVLVKRYPTDPLLLTSTQMFFGGAMLLITSLFTEEVSLEAIPLEFYGALLWLSFVSAAAFSIWYSLLQKQEMKITEINIVKFLIPISGAVLSWIVFAEEHPDILSIIGMSIISISVILFYSQRQTAEQQEVKP